MSSQIPAGLKSAIRLNISTSKSQRDTKGSMNNLAGEGQREKNLAPH